MTQSSRVACATFALSAGAYGVVVGALGLTFNVTPFWFGVTALIAGVASRQPRLVAIAFPLIGWGTAVLLVREGALPHGREAAADLVGAGAGMLAASVWTWRHHISTVGAAATLLSGGVAFYLAFDLAPLGRWPAWAVLMLVWAVAELARPAARPVHP